MMNTAPVPGPCVRRLLTISPLPLLSAPLYPLEAVSAYHAGRMDTDDRREDGYPSRVVGAPAHHTCEQGRHTLLEQDQAATFDVARVLPDRSRRSLPSPQALCPAGTAPPPPRQGVGEQRLRRMGSPRSRRPTART